MDACCFYCCNRFDVKDFKTAINYIFFLFCSENCKQTFIAVAHGLLNDDDYYPAENGINPVFLYNFVKEHDLKKSSLTIKEKAPDETNFTGYCLICNFALGDHIPWYYLQEGVCSGKCKQSKINKFKEMLEDYKSKEDILLL